ncbi:glycosyltransferase family 4 protein [Cellulomonas soli]|uniref:D-inositol 3-phosphate glycosyltransferase n=1 Tax=Cellulomonas soli TaxID=931535 RepID=A0A512P8V9_9CELL|nr:glycosyltransferase family 4 protein [Cellulomonas soli]NYI57859.1 glycosyltransferase involved in cell wall biosynthesis [Cellulomonas soli]GEP67643.1 GDP-mannose-dependent alpha-(1-6)-phosphatidylinositol dimannoside mannosyltransferase [Cellulomonas soli]
MRIVHVSDCYPPRTGGIESQVGDLAAHQVAAGHEVHVFTATLGNHGERGGAVHLERGVHVHRMGARLPFDLPVNPRDARLFRAAFASVRPDVVHVHAGVVSPFAYDGVRLAVEADLPTVVTWHCMLDGTVPAVRLLARTTRFPLGSVALSAVSEAAAGRVREAFGGPVHLMPNGIDLDAWAPDLTGPTGPAAESATGPTTRPTTGPTHGDEEPAPLRLVSTMRLAPRKRAVPLVGLVAEAVRRLPPDRVRLSLIGSGPARSRVEAAVADRGLQRVVELRGRLTREEVRAAYAHADVFLAPAELEAFGIAALEARTAGLAVVARRGTGIAEFVEDGVDGLLVADDAEMTEAVVHLVRDRRLLDGVRTHNRAVRPPFGWPHVLGAAEREYARARALRGL